MALVAAVIAACGFAVWYFALRGPKDDFGRFQGEWQVFVPAGERDGQPAARPTPITIRVTGERWVLTANGQESGRYVMVLREAADPKEIDLVQLGKDDKPTGQGSHGVYLIGADQILVAHAPASDPRPTRVANVDDATVWLLERVK